MTANVSVEDICARIALLGRSAPGLRQVIDPPPANMNTGQLPLAYVFSGQASYALDAEGAGRDIVTRSFRFQVAVISIAQGDPNTREKIVRPLIDTTTNHFRSYPGLNQLAFIKTSRVLSDSGIAILPEFGGKFIGFELRLEVAYLQVRTLARGE